MNIKNKLNYLKDKWLDLLDLFSNQRYLIYPNHQNIKHSYTHYYPGQDVWCSYNCLHGIVQDHVSAIKPYRSHDYLISFEDGTTQNVDSKWLWSKAEIRSYCSEYILSHNEFNWELSFIDSVSSEIEHVRQAVQIRIRDRYKTIGYIIKVFLNENRVRHDFVLSDRHFLTDDLFHRIKHNLRYLDRVEGAH